MMAGATPDLTDSGGDGAVARGGNTPAATAAPHAGTR
jgi:hypothetical protein